jgi:DNA-binding protein HU-beta
LRETLTPPERSFLYLARIVLTNGTVRAIAPESRGDQRVSKKFLTDVIVRSTEMPTLAANELASDIIAAIKAEIVESGRFTIPDFGAFIVRETAKRSALNPRTGEKVAVKAGATVRFKASPALKDAAFAGMKKAKRKAAKA